MSIRRQITYKHEHKKFSGFATVSNSSKKDSNPELAVAKDALVFMAVGPDFRIAVAYFLLNGLESIDRAALTREVIRSVHGTGAEIILLTSDGLRANMVVAQLIGADFKAGKPFFLNPYKPDHRIYIIFDPAHMLKLVRKYFAERQLYHNGNKLQWNLLEILARKQDSDNFELGNKLSHRHINYETAKMDVRLAVETFSNSVADALQQLDEDGYEDFIGCNASVEFIRLMNNLFDVTNYGEGKKTDDRFKQPISDSTIDSVRELFDEGREFIKQITIEHSSRSKKEKKNRIIPVLQSRSSMGFFGIMQNITSTIGIYEDYVRGGSLDVFYPFQYSQDHLETYFSLVRSCGGANNNPNEEQFCAAYRKLLFCVPHLSARGTNCNLDVTNILSVSSAYPPVLSSGNSISAEIGTEIKIGMSYDDLLNVPLEPYEQHMCAYLAANVETGMIRNIKARTKAACQDCSKVFEENLKIIDTFIARKNMAQPCSGTRDLIVVSNSVINLLKINEHIGFQTITKTITGILNMDRLYESSQFNDHHPAERQINCTNMTHKEQFIHAIVEEYMHMKSTKIGKRITIEEQGSSIRKKSTRNVILAGQ